MDVSEEHVLKTPESISVKYTELGSVMDASEEQP
jgi:hypothetical protein